MSKTVQTLKVLSEPTEAMELQDMVEQRWQEAAWVAKPNTPVGRGILIRIRATPGSTLMAIA